MQPARRGVLIALAAVLLFVVAGGWVERTSVGSPASQRYAEAVVGQPGRINPLHAQSGADADLVALVFSGLTRIAPDGSAELDLAESWEVTPDGLTYTFTLRSGVTWHDGAPLTAHDVAFTLERLQAEDFGGSPALQAEWSGVRAFVVDERTVLLRLPEPAADFLLRASLGLLPRHLADRMDPPPGFEVAPFDRAPVGTGPYRLTRLNDERADLERNLNYAHGAPAIERIELLFANDLAGQLRLLASGDVDAALLGEQPSDPEAEALEVREDLTTTLLPRSAYTVLYFNTATPPLNDPALRRALAASIDRAAALAAVDAERFRVGDGVIVPGSWAYDPDAPIFAAELDDLWNATGWARAGTGTRERDGEPLRLELITNNDPHREALAVAIANQLGAQGVAVDVTPMPAGRMIEDHMRPGAYQLALFGWEATADPDPYPGWHGSQIGSGNVAAFQDAEADALLEAARTTLDVAERRELYRLYHARFAQQAPSVVIAYPQRLYVHPDGLRGLEPGLLVDPAGRFRGVHRWELR